MSLQVDLSLSLYCDVVNIGLAEIYYWFDVVRRALMQLGVIIVFPPVVKIKE